MKLIYTLEITNEKGNEKWNRIFLAGPTHRFPGKHSWRTDVVSLLEKDGFDGIVYIPEYRNGERSEQWTYSRQVDWETKHLNECDVIIFWIPRLLPDLPAFTTNVEFGEWMKSGKIVIGSPQHAEKNRYLKERCSRLGVQWNDTISMCVQNSLRKISEAETSTTKMWFTADTHFGHQRTLELSKRPFHSVEEMDWEMVKRWNMVVGNDDTVYHLGDFGDPSFIKHLNGNKIVFVPGNYDTPEIVEELKKDSRIMIPMTLHQQFVDTPETSLYLIHEPEKYYTYRSIKTFCLFGHIHKLQMVKKNGLNVGVDCHNFTPIDLDTVLFYKAAIENHYDQNVFMGNTK